MDIRREGFFGQLVVSGVKSPTAHRGSILGIISESLKDLSSMRVRNNADGESEIVIRIRNKAFDTSKESSQYLDKSVEVDALLDSAVEEDHPRPNETFDEFFQRLMTGGLPRASAIMLAADWFQIPADAQTTGWLSDPKALRFRELNSRSEAYEAAIPTEYESLKRYVQTTYPSFCEHLTFRTA